MKKHSPWDYWVIETWVTGDWHIWTSRRTFRDIVAALGLVSALRQRIRVVRWFSITDDSEVLWHGR